MDVIKELKQKPLVDFFETHLNLSLIKKGNKYCCLCPIHIDSNPSFYIDPVKNKCSCFGSCGLINGDIIDFIVKYKSLTIGEGINWLANKYGIVSNYKTTEGNTNEEYYEICNFVANYYSDDVHFKKSYSKFGVEYLRSRHLTRGVVRDFKLGYAPHPSITGKWGFLADVLKQERFSLEICEQIGLIKKGKKDYYDTFIDRIIFPIFDLKDRCIGFNSRILPYSNNQNHIPKYLLSKESPVFKKSNFIYGLNNSLRYIRQENVCYIVEGCFDCYRMWSYGYKNTIPLLGGKLFQNFQTNKSERIHSFTEHFCGLPDVSTYIFLMDPDKAGIKYSLENGAELIKWGKNVLICELDKDPDDLLKEEVDLAIMNAKSFIDFYLKYNYRYQTNEHKLCVLDNICKVFNGINREQVILYAIELEKKINVPLGLILYRFGLEDNLNYGEIFRGHQGLNTV